MSRKAAVSIAAAHALASCGNAAPGEEKRPPADAVAAAALNEQIGCQRAVTAALRLP